MMVCVGGGLELIVRWVMLKVLASGYGIYSLPEAKEEQVYIPNTLRDLCVVPVPVRAAISPDTSAWERGCWAYWSGFAHKERSWSSFTHNTRKRLQPRNFRRSRWMIDVGWAFHFTHK